MENFSFQIHPDSQRLLESIGLLKGDPGKNEGQNGHIRSASSSPMFWNQQDSRSNGPKPSSVYTNGKLDDHFNHQQHNVTASPSKTPHTCGVHALISSNSANYLEIVDLPAGESREKLDGSFVMLKNHTTTGGQLWTQRVRIGDRLVTVDGRKLETFEQAQAAVEGPHGSVVELGFYRERGAPRQFEVDVVRTLNIGEDVELAVYKELGRLLESEDCKFEARRIDSDSGDVERFVNVVHDDIFSKVSSLLHTVHQQEAYLEAKSTENNRIQSSLSKAQKELSQVNPQTLQDLQIQLEQANKEIERLRANESVSLAVGLTGSDDMKHLSDMGGFEEKLRSDIAQVVGMDKGRIELIGMQKRGPDAKWEMDLNILKCRAAGDRPADDLARDLIDQAQNNRGVLHSRPSMGTIRGARRVESHKVIELLRQRVSQLQGQVRSSEEALKNRAAEQATQQKAAENSSQNELSRLRMEAEMHKSKMQSLAASLSKSAAELQEQESKQRKVEMDLQSSEQGLRNAMLEIGRLKEALNAAMSREAAAQEEMVALSRRHQEVFASSEKALDEARNTLAARQRQGDEIALLNQKLALAEEARVSTQRKHAEEIFMLQDRLSKSAEAFSKERAEFLAHLKASEESVRHLRQCTDDSTRSQEASSKQLVVAEEIARNSVMQKEAFERTARECKDELEKVRLSNVFLQNEVTSLAEELGQLKVKERHLVIEESTWKRVEKPRLEETLVMLKHEIERMTGEMASLRVNSDEANSKKSTQLLEEVRLKEVLLLRERSEKNALLNELGKQNDSLKHRIEQLELQETFLRNQLDKSTQVGQDHLRDKDKCQGEVQRLTDQLKQSKEAHDELVGDRKRLMKALEAHQVQTMLSGGPMSTGGYMSQGESDKRIRELTARCQELTVLLNEKEEMRRQSSQEAKDLGTVKNVLQESESKHQAQIQALEAKLADERSQQQQQLRALTARARELEEVLQEKERERRQASSEAEGLKAALQRR